MMGAGTMRGRTPTEVRRQRVDESAGHTYEWKCSFCDEGATRKVDVGLGHRVPVCEEPACILKLKALSRRPWLDVVAEMAQAPRPAPAQPGPERMEDRGGSPGGRLYQVDPAAVENLKARLAAKEQAAEQKPKSKKPAEPAKENDVDVSKRDPTKFDDLTAKDVARWARLRRQKKSYKWIQENDELHPSSYALAKYLKQYGYDTKGNPLDESEPEPDDEPAEEKRQVEAIPGLVGTSYIADELDVDEDTVTRYIRQEKLRAQKVGAKWAVARADADAFIEAYLSEPKLPAVAEQKEKRQVERLEVHLPEGQEREPEAAAPLASNGNDLAVAEAPDLDRQLAAVQQLVATLQAGSVQVSGRIRLELAVEVEL